MTWAVLLLALVSVQRLGELALAKRNTQRLLARGAREAAPGHYPLIVVLHATWLAGLWWLAWNAPINLYWLAIFIVLQLLRVWVIATLGERWTTRIIVLPGAVRVRHGPFRFLNHPNYTIVIAEIAVLPLVFGLFSYAIAFSVINAAILYIRISAESAALRDAQSD